mmetsp:Transcript_33756/g.107855  ORF Transcript_33756/g.107855 Transcript_33756/m.107855 type:complete len:88 (+) Transcript_33756:323-586(+)
MADSEEASAVIVTGIADAEVLKFRHANPKRAGSTSRKRYEAYKGSRTPRQFYLSNGTAADLRHDAARGFVEIANGQTADTIVEVLKR